MRNNKKVLEIILIIVLGLYLLLTILKIFGIYSYVALTNSMSPSIREGSLCFINGNEKFDNIKEKVYLK